VAACIDFTPEIARQQPALLGRYLTEVERIPEQSLRFHRAEHDPAAFTGLAFPPFPANCGQFVQQTVAPAAQSIWIRRGAFHWQAPK
jgi:hypothetical protein